LRRLGIEVALSYQRGRRFTVSATRLIEDCTLFKNDLSLLSVPDNIKSSVPLEVLRVFIFAHESKFRLALAAVQLSTFLSPALFVEETVDPEARARRNAVDKTVPRRRHPAASAPVE
jgi:hypothetical protein